MAPDIPRSEYPQPQFQRDAWLNLNGTWEFAFDDQDVGVDSNWICDPRPFTRSILVPFCFESVRSGIGETAIHPRVWYRRSFEIPEEWAASRVLLCFGAVDYRALVWVNGRLAGSHEGGHTPFRFDVSTLLKAGENLLVVRAEDPPDRSVPRGKQHWESESRGIFYRRTTGIWQTVWLEAVGQSWIERLRVHTVPDGTVEFEVGAAHGRPGLEVRATVSRNGTEAAVAAVRSVNGYAVVTAKIADREFWSPAHPVLYDVTVELLFQGELLDRVRAYFGFRFVSIQDNRVLINGQPCFLAFVLDQGYWPESNLTPPSDEAIREDIRLTLAMGFNGVRKHQKIEDPRFLYWADRMGLLVSAEMPNAYVFSEETVERVTREWMEAVQRDANHPSIIIWAPLNESWGVPDLNDRRQLAHIRAMAGLTRSLDASRLVVDNDGWEHTEMTDLFAIHDYTPEGELFYERFRGLERAGTPVPSFSIPALAPGCVYNGSPVYLSEFGGIGLAPAGEIVPRDSWGYAGIAESADAAFERLKGLYEAIVRIPAFAGFCYTQLVDVEQEINGLLTYDRRPKFELGAIRRLNEMFRLSQE